MFKGLGDGILEKETQANGRQVPVHYLFETESHSTSQAVLELARLPGLNFLILLPLECWDYRSLAGLISFAYKRNCNKFNTILKKKDEEYTIIPIIK